jgi:hypothetical protein
VVLHLNFLRQREEPLKHIVGFIDQRLRYAMPADAAETELAIGRAEFGNKGGYREWERECS